MVKVIALSCTKLFRRAELRDRCWRGIKKDNDWFVHDITRVRWINFIILTYICVWLVRIIYTWCGVASVRRIYTRDMRKEATVQKIYIYRADKARLSVRLSRWRRYKFQLRLHYSLCSEQMLRTVLPWFGVTIDRSGGSIMWHTCVDKKKRKRKVQIRLAK